MEDGGGFGGGRGGKPSISADGIGAIAPEFVLEPAIDQVSTVGGYCLTTIMVKTTCMDWFLERKTTSGYDRKMV